MKAFFVLLPIMVAANLAPAFAADVCPVTPNGSKAAWCSYGLAGGIIPIARTGNELTKNLPVKYKICIADHVPPGSLLTVFHEDFPGDPRGRTQLSETHRCDWFRAPVLEVQYGAPHPQQDIIGGTYEAFLTDRFVKAPVPMKVSEPVSIIAACKNVGDGSECDVPLPRGASRNFRLCFAPGYLVDPNHAGRVTLRANGFAFVPDPGKNDYDPRNADITQTCMDVFRANSLLIAIANRVAANKSVKIQLQQLYSGPK